MEEFVHILALFYFYNPSLNNQFKKGKRSKFRATTLVALGKLNSTAGKKCNTRKSKIFR